MPDFNKRTVNVRRVDECRTLDELFRHCLPAFGGAFLRRIYTILDQAIGIGCPITLAVAGPVTVSGQHQVWLIPLLETGWIAYLSTTDAVCYHDGHRSLDAHRYPIHESPIIVGGHGGSSALLSTLTLWAMRVARPNPEFGLDLDLRAELVESCADHRWGVFVHPVLALTPVIRGGRVPKNYNVQPEPVHGQIL